MAGKVFLKTE